MNPLKADPMKTGMLGAVLSVLISFKLLSDGFVAVGVFAGVAAVAIALIAIPSPKRANNEGGQ